MTPSSVMTHHRVPGHPVIAVLVYWIATKAAQVITNVVIIIVNAPMLLAHLVCAAILLVHAGITLMAMLPAKLS